jgi:hypothetical protein
MEPDPPSHVPVSLQTKTQYFYCTFVQIQAELFFVLTFIPWYSRCCKNRGADLFKLSNNTNTSRNTRIQEIAIFLSFRYFYNVHVLLLHSYRVNLQYFVFQKFVFFSCWLPLLAFDRNNVTIIFHLFIFSYLSLSPQKSLHRLDIIQ